MLRLRRALTRGAVVTALWGVASAALTRVLMRAVALLTNGAPEFSWVGTVGIAVVYTAALLPGAVALAYSDGRWPYVVLGGGVALLAFEAVAIGTAETANASGMTAWRWAGLVAVLLVMAVVYAAQVILVHRGARAGRRLPTTTSRSAAAPSHPST